MAKFSDRIGVTQPATKLQVKSMNNELRNSLWNLLVTNFTYHWATSGEILSFHHFKIPIDDVGSGSAFKRWLKHTFMEMTWFNVYNLMEFVLQNIEKITDHDIYKSVFESRLNRILERELSGYRAIKGQLVPITDDQEIEVIRQAASIPSSFGLNGVKEHITKALQLLGKKPDPDYPNSIKESISAVESICELLTGEKAYGKALKILSEKISLHRALEKGFLSLYGYASDEDGIRHAILELKDVGFAEAKFMLVACSAFVNFVIDKARKANMFK